MKLIDDLTAIVGPQNVISGAEGKRYSTDWTGKYVSNPVAIVRPGSTEDVAAIVKLAAESRTPIVPMSGNTGLTGATKSDGCIILSVERMNKIRDIRPDAGIAIVDAGVVLTNLHDAADAQDMVFPLFFGARGSAMIGGVLGTNAGGSNVVRYGNTRALCLGVEVVTPSGEVLNLMSELRKDNSGYDLKDLYIGAEGTLGIITAAVMKLFPKPKAYATAMVAMPSLEDALRLLGRLQEISGGGVEAIEYMPRAYIEEHMRKFPDARAPFETMHEVNILIEIAASAERDVTPTETGEIPISTMLEETLASMMEAGQILDAVVAQNDAQRQEMWKRREDAGEVVLDERPHVNCDIAVPIDKVSKFLERIDQAVPGIDQNAKTVSVSHLGDGNVHYTIWPTSADIDLKERLTEKVEEVALDLGGSFSAEHGVGISKLGSMSRRKDPAALTVMRQIKAAMDPLGIMNPGKVLPEDT
jgi:FAD/FMN-containing dehydrogenase